MRFAVISPFLAVAAAAVSKLPPNAKFDYQIGGSYTPASDVRVVTRDRTSSPYTSNSTSIYNICYINAFQTQPNERAFWKQSGRDALLLRTKKGKYFADPDWEGEYFLDTSTDAKRSAIAKIVNGWIDGCANKGFKAVELDNLDVRLELQSVALIHPLFP